MCGIIGFSSKNATASDIEILRKVMIESRIRGKHASGIAWSDGLSIHSRVLPIPIDQLVQKFDLHSLVRGGQISLISHARYSTSDIKYNQPIIGDTMAIAHNGVITQDSPENWEKSYGFKCETHNDSELLLRVLEKGKQPDKVFPDSSIAAVTLTKDGQIKAIRNGLRPLWQGKIGEGVVYASTHDILLRSGVKDIKKLKPDHKSDELQRRDFEKWKSPISRTPILTKSS